MGIKGAAIATITTQALAFLIALIILVRGNIIDLMKDKKIRFFFDQNGILTEKFNLEYFGLLIS